MQKALEARLNLIEYLVKNGGKKQQESWKQLEEQFEIESVSRTGDRARQYWNWYLKYGQHKGQLVPDPEQDPREDEPKLERSDVTSLTLKSTWQVQKKGGEVVWLESYRNDFTPENIWSFREQIIKDVQEFSPTRHTVYSYDEAEYLLEISMPDLHIGRDILKNQVDYYKDVLFKMVSKAVHKYSIGRVLYVMGNDLLNTDNTEYRTTKGTQQFDYDKWYDTFQSAWKLQVDCIESLKAIAPVDVVTVAGNHDRSRLFYLADVVKGWFRSDESVNIENSMDPFKFYSWGNTMLMFEHGELKPDEYPLIMATEQPLMWAKSKFRETHTGHLHKEMLNEKRGVKMRFLPSLAKMSDWEKYKGYSHLKQAQALLWHKKEGLEHIMITNGKTERAWNK